VAHLSEGTLRRKFDDEVALTDSDARHFAACADCQARYATVADDARMAASLLTAPDLKVDVASAFKHVRSAPAAQPRFGIRLPLMRPASRPMFIGLAAAAVLVAMIGTVIAYDALTVFNPTTVTPVPVTVADLQSLSELGTYGTVTWTSQLQPQIVANATDAATVSGLKVPIVGTLPAGVSSIVTYAAMPQAVGVFTFDAAKAAAAAAKAGKALPPMPSGMDGSTLTITVGPAVVEIFGDLKSAGSTSTTTLPSLPQLVVGESTAPVVTSSHATVMDLEKYLLEQPGITPQLAAAIQALGDPSKTLPIPVPIQFTTSTTVPVHGVNGLALGDNTGLGAAVIWIKDGVIYGVAGTVKQNDLVTFANQLS
jgi:hypothetical protein